jgi:hypothetical protein
MKRLLASVTRLDIWILDRLFQPLVKRSSLALRHRPALLALFGLLACSTYVLVRLLLFLPRLFAQSFDWSDVRANIIPAAISFLVTSLLIMIAVNLCEDPSSDWFRTQGAVVRYAFLVLGAVSLYEWAWIAVVVWLWWLSAGIMACHAGLTRT